MPAEGKKMKEVVIIGAGVIGLTVAHVLSSDEQNAYKITIVARDMPEDLDSSAFASPWAGANWSPMRGFDENTIRRETNTFNKFWSMIPTGLVLELPSRVYYPQTEGLADLWYKSLVRNFRVIPQDEIPTGAAGGVAFSTYSINPELYLLHLYSLLRAQGVSFVRRRLHSLREAAVLAGSEAIVVNASGLGARSLLGVSDSAVYPIRGQTIIAHAPNVREFLSFPLGVGSLPGEATYIIPRPAPPGHVLLGGTYQEDEWNTSWDAETAKGILERCSKLAPELREGAKIVKHGVGLRPARKGGPRVEVEWLAEGKAEELAPVGAELKGKVLVVHAYGFGAAGYQNSWGAAEEVAGLIAQNFGGL